MNKYYGIRIKGTEELLGYRIKLFINECNRYIIQLCDNKKIWLTNSKIEAEEIVSETYSEYNFINIPQNSEGKLEVVEVTLNF